MELLLLECMPAVHEDHPRLIGQAEHGYHVSDRSALLELERTGVPPALAVGLEP